MKGRVAAGILLLVAPLARAGDDGFERRPPEQLPVELPAGWQPYSSGLEAAVGYVRFDDLGHAGAESAEGTAAQLVTRFTLVGGSYFSIGGEYQWLDRATGSAIGFGYVRVGVGFRVRLISATELGMELGAQGQIGRDFFGTDRVTEDAEYGRVWARSAMPGGAQLQAGVTLGSGVRSADLRCEWPVLVRRLNLGAMLRAGREEDAEFWSVGPSMRWSFGASE